MGLRWLALRLVPRLWWNRQEAHAMSGSGHARELNRTQKVEAAYLNEYLTRQRVEKLERELSEWRSLAANSWRAHEAVLKRSFWGRFLWLLTGR